MSRHTPTPWTVLKVDDHYQINAQPQFLRGFSNNIAIVESEADANIMNAAPEMLKMLHEIYENDGRIGAKMYKSLYELIKPLI